MQKTELNPSAAISSAKSPMWGYSWVGLVALVLLAHGVMLQNDFITLDDQAYVYNNPQVLNGLTPGTIAWAFSSFNVGNWHPLTMLSHLMDVSLFGLDPMGHHATSLLLHCLNALVWFEAITRLTGQRGRAWWVAALMAVHPAHVESVAWISSRKDVLCLLFLGIALLGYVGWVRAQPGRGWKYQVWTIIAFACALMSKPTAVSFPLLLLLLDFWPLNRFSGGLPGPQAQAQGLRQAGRLVWEKAPLIAMSGVICIVTIWAQRSSGAITTVEHVGLGPRLANAINAYVEYVRMFFWPSGLSVLYPRLPVQYLFLKAAALLAVTASVVWSAWRLGGNQRCLAVGWFWFLIAMVPMIGLVQVGMQAMADRYTYIPFIGLYIALVWSVGEAVDRMGRLRPAAIGLGIAMLAALTFLTHAQTRRWESSITLFSYGLSVTGPNADLEDYLGRAHNLMGQPEEARKHFEKSLAIRPDNREAAENLGFVLMVLDRPQASVEAYRLAMGLGDMSPGSEVNFGWALLQSGQPAQAVQVFQLVLDRTGTRWETLMALGAALGEMKETARALEVLNQAKALNPANLTVDYYIANTLVCAAEYQQALSLLQASFQANPENFAAQRLMAKAWLGLGEKARARAILLEVLRQNPDDKRAQKALSECGDG